MQAALLDFTETVKTYVDEVAAADKPEATEVKEGDSDDPLVKRLKVLEQKLADAEKQEQQRQEENARLRFEAELSKAIATHNPQYLDQVQGILTSQLKDSKETAVGWTVNGKTITEAVAEFFATPFGKHLLPPDPVAGTGTRQPEKQPKTQSNDDAIVSAFL